MVLWEPPPPIRVRRTLKPGHYVRIAGSQAGKNSRFDLPDSDHPRHFVSLSAARRHSYLLIQEILTKSEEYVDAEIEIQILHVGSDGTEKLNEGFVIHAERYLARREKLAVQG
jgi:hypothetical protein